MARTDPATNLTLCESHVVVKATLSDGTILRLGSATLTNVIEEDSSGYSYVAKIIRDSQLKMSSTNAADQMSVGAENVDKELGLTINDQSKSLVGAKVICSKVFAEIENEVDVLGYSPAAYFDAGKLGVTQNLSQDDAISTWEDLSGNLHNGNTTGSIFFKRRVINGRPSVLFSDNDMTIDGVFPVAQVFAVFRSISSVFDRGSIVGSNSFANRLFGFQNETTQMEAPFPRSVRKNGADLSSPFDLGDITQPIILNVKTNNPTAVRQYFINNMEGLRTGFNLSELIMFGTDLSAEDEQHIESYLARKYGVTLPYVIPRTWDSKVLMHGEISNVEASSEEVTIKIVSDIAPNVAFIAGRPVQALCPLIFKGDRCLYSGPETTCNKLYISEGGCSGRNNQHHFGGAVIKGEVGVIVHGGIDTYIGDEERYNYYGHYPDPVSGRVYIMQL